MMSSWFRDLLHEGCLSTLQSLDRTGYLELKKLSVQDFNQMLAEVAVYGNAEMLDWFLARALEVHGKTFKHDVLSFSKATLCFSAMEGGSLNVVKWLHANGLPHKRQRSR